MAEEFIEKRILVPVEFEQEKDVWLKEGIFSNDEEVTSYAYGILRAAVEEFKNYRHVDMRFDAFNYDVKVDISPITLQKLN